LSGLGEEWSWRIPQRLKPDDFSRHYRRPEGLLHPAKATIYQNLSQNEFFRILKHYRDSTHYIFRGIAMGDIANSGFDPNAKPCAEALQSAQKRVRLAFFLNMAASCIILLIVINLWNSLLVHNKLLQDRKLSDKFEYLKEYSKQIADQSFYQIPSLGIQIRVMI
jgi:hypothetical protein